MNERMTITREFHVARRNHGRKQLRDGAAPEVPTGRVPRIARLMELARFGHITTARMTQIMKLLNLAPDIQEQVLFLARTERGRDAIKETDVRPIARILDWRKQRRMWAALQRRVDRENPDSP